MDMKILKPFIDGTIHTLGIQLRVEVRPGKPYLKQTAPELARIDIAGVVGVYTQNFKGSICLCFPEKTFLSAMEQMLGEKYSTINQEIADGAGEMMNMIFGYAKTKLNEEGHQLEKALPNIVRGENIKISQKNANSVIILPFDCDLGRFHLEVAFE